ncbi:unnamed protein product, partial [Phaeothamnion confervicola]
LSFRSFRRWRLLRPSARRQNPRKNEQEQDAQFNVLVEGTRWLEHVRAVLAAAWSAACAVERLRAAVLVHCSHGWDRTSQVCGLAQLLLDPFYRTIHGFQILVEKDWMSFGHPFQMRYGHGLKRGAAGDREDQRCPIFLQFLDCTWQLVNQFPAAFEFNGRYLLAIAAHLCSGRFGTLLGNCEADRVGTL